MSVTSRASKLKVVAIVQARMGSRRLPGKVLEDLEGEYCSGWGGEITFQRARLINEVLVETTDRAPDDAIVEEMSKMDCARFSGRSRRCARPLFPCGATSKADIVVRVTSDCPLIDPEVTDKTHRRIS